MNRVIFQKKKRERKKRAKMCDAVEIPLFEQQTCKFMKTIFEDQMYFYRSIFFFRFQNI